MKVKPYIFYLQNTVTGGCLYVDAGGNIQEVSIMAAGTAQDVSLKHAPDGWMEATLGYKRNPKYYGFNRSYSDPLKLVKDAAFIARTKFYLETGVETKLSLLILKYNSQPQIGDPLYKLYHKAPFEFPQMNDRVAESFQCNLLEGGILQLLKTYENTVFSIPCDGSIPENIKVNMDGMYFQDTFNYQILPGILTHPVNDPSIPQTIPVSFLSNDGDNIGIIHNDQELSTLTRYNDLNGYLPTSPNFLFQSQRSIYVRIKGHINVVPTDGATYLGLSYYTSLSTVIPGFKCTNAGSLLTPTQPVPYTPQSDDNYQVYIPAATTIYFDKTIALAPGQNLFIMGTGVNAASLISVLGGSFTMEFNSIAANTAPWCITWYDLFKLLIQNVNKVASTQFQTLNFGFDSQLLQSKLNLVVTSGDAIRASGDPNYQKFYNAIQANPNFPNLNLSYSYGPVIKTSISDAFISFNAVLSGSLGNQTLSGEGETIFFEPKGYVFDSSKPTFNLGEVSEFSNGIDREKMFTILKIGYPEQQYDQKAGKYEWNTTLQMVSPINSIPSKTLEIISRYRADAYGIERLRANIDSTSHTKNTSDNSVFIINTDRSNFIYDYFEMNFISAIPDVTNGNNTNQKLIQSLLNQSLNMSVLRAGYVSVNNDPSILVLSQNGLSASMPLAINIAGFLNGNPANALTGAPADQITISLFVNGARVTPLAPPYIITSTSAATPIAITDNITRTWNVNDAIYLQVTTTATGSAQLDSVDLNMNSGYFDASGANIAIDPGASNKMIALPTINAPRIGGFPGTPVLSYGFQYIQFNSNLSNKNFNTTFTFSGEVYGTSTPGIEVDLRVFSAAAPATNVSDTFAMNTSGGWQPFNSFFTFNRDWQLGDIMYVLGSNYSNLTTEFQSLDLQMNSTAIKAYSLKRVQYDTISGIPNLCGYVTEAVTISTLAGPVTIQVQTAQPITTGPGAPYNIEDINPKQMLLNWGNYIRSILWDQQAGQLLFSRLDKNQYLITTLNGKSLVQNANVNIGDLDPALFTLNKATFKTKVPLGFDDMMRNSVNAFLSWTYNGQPFYGFAEEMKQKATLNEMQSWEVLIA